MQFPGKETVGPIHSNFSRVMGTRYRWALGLLLATTVLTFLLGDWCLRSQESLSEWINLSGRQRMLSQQAALAGSALCRKLSRGEKERWRVLFQQNVDAFRAAHRRLWEHAASGLGDATLASELEKIYNGPGALREQVDRQQDLARRILEVARGNAETARLTALVDELTALSFPLLDTLEKVVAAYEQASDRTFSNSLSLKWLALAITLLLLWVQLRFVFRPLVQTTRVAIDCLSLARAERDRNEETAFGCHQAQAKHRRWYLRPVSEDFGPAPTGGPATRP